MPCLPARVRHIMARRILCPISLIREDGLRTVEYAVVLAMVVTASLVLISPLAQHLREIFQTLNQALRSGM